MKFYRVYIEITNVCGLRCSFCPSKEKMSADLEMDLTFFEKIISQAKAYTKEIACHVVGDPMTLSNLNDYLDIIHKHGLKAMLTSSGYFLKKHSYETLFHPCVKQINLSLNSFNKNDTQYTFEQYMAPILALCQEKLARERELFINLRVWNLDESMSESTFNQTLFDLLSDYFDVPLNLSEIYSQKPKSIRLENKIRIHFDTYFQWPSLSNENYGHGSCQGLSSHIAILADGSVVPCCLDCDGVIKLGDLHEQSLRDIVNSPRAKRMLEGFQEDKAHEELCQK